MLCSRRMLNSSVTNLIYPPACFLCHRRAPEHAPLCDACESALEPCRPPICDRCGIALQGAYDARMSCRRCDRAGTDLAGEEVSRRAGVATAVQALAFHQARAPFVYSDTVREAVHAFKYGHHPRLGRWFAERMAQTVMDEFPVADIRRVLPVPSHWLKGRLTGFDHTVVLAESVARLLQLPCDRRAVSRIKWTATQTRLTIRQRAQNVREAFQATPPASGRTEAVLLVDDVLTTGATADACARALREAGFGDVFVITAACA